MKDKLKTLMEEKNVLQEELATAVGVSQTFISYILNGFKTPSLDVAKRIADYLGVTVDELID